MSNICDVVTGENNSFGMGQNSVYSILITIIGSLCLLLFCILCITYMLLIFDALCVLKC